MIEEGKTPKVDALIYLILSNDIPLVIDADCASSSSARHIEGGEGAVVVDETMHVQTSEIVAGNLTAVVDGDGKRYVARHVEGSDGAAVAVIDEAMHAAIDVISGN